MAGRVPFDKKDKDDLADFLFFRFGSTSPSNLKATFEEMAKKHPSHTYQSWLDHYKHNKGDFVTMVMLRDRNRKREQERQKEQARAASGTATPIPSATTQKRQRRDSMDSVASDESSLTAPGSKKAKIVSPPKRSPFTTDDLREFAKMMVEADTQGWTKQEVYVRLERKYPEHTASSWQSCLKVGDRQATYDKFLKQEKRYASEEAAAKKRQRIAARKEAREEAPAVDKGQTSARNSTTPSTSTVPVVRKDASTSAATLSNSAKRNSVQPLDRTAPVARKEPSKSAAPPSDSGKRNSIPPSNGKARVVRKDGFMTATWVAPAYTGPAPEVRRSASKSATPLSDSAKQNSIPPVEEIAPVAQRNASKSATPQLNKDKAIVVTPARVEKHRPVPVFSEEEIDTLIFVMSVAQKKSENMDTVWATCRRGFLKQRPEEEWKQYWLKHQHTLQPQIDYNIKEARENDAAKAAKLSSTLKMAGEDIFPASDDSNAVAAGNSMEAEDEVDELESDVDTPGAMSPAVQRYTSTVPSETTAISKIPPTETATGAPRQSTSLQKSESTSSATSALHEVLVDAAGLIPLQFSPPSPFLDASSVTARAEESSDPMDLNFNDVFETAPLALEEDELRIESLLATPRVSAPTPSNSTKPLSRLDVIPPRPRSVSPLAFNPSETQIAALQIGKSIPKTSLFKDPSSSASSSSRSLSPAENSIVSATRREESEVRAAYPTALDILAMQLATSRESMEPEMEADWLALEGAALSVFIDYHKLLFVEEEDQAQEEQVILELEADRLESLRQAELLEQEREELCRQAEEHRLREEVEEAEIDRLEEQDHLDREAHLLECRKQAEEAERREQTDEAELRERAEETERRGQAEAANLRERAKKAKFEATRLKKEKAQHMELERVKQEANAARIRQERDTESREVELQQQIERTSRSESVSERGKAKRLEAERKMEKKREQTEARLQQRQREDEEALIELQELEASLQEAMRMEEMEAEIEAEAERARLKELQEREMLRAEKKEAKLRVEEAARLRAQEAAKPQAKEKARPQARGASEARSKNAIAPLSNTSYRQSPAYHPRQQSSVNRSSNSPSLSKPLVSSAPLIEGKQTLRMELKPYSKAYGVSMAQTLSLFSACSCPKDLHILGRALKYFTLGNKGLPENERLKLREEMSRQVWSPEEDIALLQGSRAEMGGLLSAKGDDGIAERRKFLKGSGYSTVKDLLDRRNTWPFPPSAVL